MDALNGIASLIACLTYRDMKELSRTLSDAASDRDFTVASRPDWADLLSDWAEARLEEAKVPDTLTLARCERCGGGGTVIESVTAGDPLSAVRALCPTCEGTGARAA